MTEKGKYRKCKGTGERDGKEMEELTPRYRHLLLSKAVVLKVVPDWRHLLRTC